MAKLEKTYPIGVHSKFYIGTVGASAVLTRVWNVRTEGLVVKDITQQEYVPALERHVPSGIRQVELTSNFYNNSDPLWQIANNAPLTGTTNSAQDMTGKYVLFIVDTASASDRCYLFPEVQVTVGRTINHNKDKPSILPITFVGYDKATASYDPLTKGTAAALGTTLGSRNPLT